MELLKKHSETILPNKLNLIFDDALLRPLKALSAPTISLRWLSKTVEFLSLAHAQAANLLSSVDFTWDDDVDAISSYLDNTLNLLHICNSISADIDRLRSHRLRFALSLHLGDLRLAREALSSGFRKPINDTEVLIRNLAPRGNVSKFGAVRRTVYAVRLVTAFFTGILVSAMEGRPEKIRVRAPAEYSWAEAFNELAAEVSGELKQQFGEEENMLEEVDDAAAVVGEACEIAKGNTDERGLKDVVGKVERAMGSFSDELEGLSERMNAMFHGVLSNRNFMLDHVRIKAQVN